MWVLQATTTDCVAHYESDFPHECRPNLRVVVGRAGGGGGAPSDRFPPGVKFPFLESFSFPRVSIFGTS
jgi:hypothetical protein